MFKINKFLLSLVNFLISFVVRVTAVQFGLIFPPKDLEKNTGAKNTHAPFFFSFFIANFIFVQ